jgi:hypothetical protein
MLIINGLRRKAKVANTSKWQNSTPKTEVFGHKTGLFCMNLSGKHGDSQRQCPLDLVSRLLKAE